MIAFELKALFKDTLQRCLPLNAIPPGAEADNAALSSPIIATPDTRFRSYVTFYSNLDNLIWRNVTTQLAIIGLGLTAIGAVIEKKIDIAPFSTRQTVTVICFGIALLTILTIYTIRRMRFHQELVERELRKLEPEGYFHARLKSTTTEWWRAAPLWTQIVFLFIAIAISALGASFLFSESRDMSKNSISPERANSEFGIFTNHEIMNNGEMRFRLMGKDGNGYIRTVAKDGSGWQNGHSHTRFSELYIVEKGWMVVATPTSSGELELAIFKPGQTYQTKAGELHNIYLPDGAVIHTVKFGILGAVEDWKPNEDFTSKTKTLTEADILRRIQGKGGVNQNGAKRNSKDRP